MIPPWCGTRGRDLQGHLAALHAFVTGHVGARRAAGDPLEEVLAEMDGLVRRAERLEDSPDELGLLRGRVRMWGLAAYVDDPELQNVPRFY